MKTTNPFEDPSHPSNGREINGLKWREVRGTKYILEHVSYIDHLKQIRKDLKDTAGAYSQSITSRSKGNIRARAFALIRMTMPAIETFARAKGSDPSWILRELGVPAPNLIWNLYRDGLMHNHSWIYARIEGRKILPALTISLGGSVGGFNMHHVSPGDGTHNLDVGELYHDFMSMLKKEIADAPTDKMVDIVAGIEYMPDSSPAVNQIINETRDSEATVQATLDWFTKRQLLKRRSQLRRQMDRLRDALSEGKIDEKQFNKGEAEVNKQIRAIDDSFQKLSAG